MPTLRQVETISRGTPTIDGAGVHLRRIFSRVESLRLDPFLLLDHFGSDNPDDYLAGFPWHPHRGIETVTYMLGGMVEHNDSIGNKGTIRSGDAQWMTAGSGIVHQEMPQPVQGVMAGFQLWINLPAQRKMTPPRYRDVKQPAIPSIALAPGVAVRAICGAIGGKRGPVQDLAVDVEYFDVSLAPRSRFMHTINHIHTACAYVFQGSGHFAGDDQRRIAGGSLVVLTDGDTVAAHTAEEPMRFLFFSGKPLAEPIAWRGPIVMNTVQELDTAFREYQDGTFIKPA
jgi:redox-sensitive bicupin YhaK (pirin superfamily)